MPDRFQYQRTTVEENLSVFELSGVPSEDDWLAAMAQAEAWLLENESRGQTEWGVVVDASGMKSINANMRRLIGEWRAKNMALIANTCLCGAYVAESAWLRGAITAVMWFARPVIPVSVKATRPEALLWIREKRRELVGH